MGRSVVIHFFNTTRYACGTIVDDVGHTQVQATFTSISSPFTGTVTLSQQRDAPDSDTTILVELAAASSTVSSAKWDGVLRTESNGQRLGG